MWTIRVAVIDASWTGFPIDLAKKRDRVSFPHATICRK
jgi:hypothetical protein